MSSVVAIRKSALPSLPENLRAYVSEFFKERTVLGIECLVAERHTYHPHGSSYARWGDGMAPSHSVDLQRFGKSEDGEVGDALRRAMARAPDDIVELFCTEQRRPSTIYDD